MWREKEQGKTEQKTLLES